jgi:hypothetical protein
MMLSMARFLFTIGLLVAAAPAFAQAPERIAPFALDVRGAFTFLGTDAVTSSSLGIADDDLASHAIGVTGGVHFYLLRGQSWALGLGGEAILATATKQRFDPEDDEIPLGPEVRRQLKGASGQVSINFGHRGGWSYLTAGMGPLQFDTHLTANTPDGARASTVNFGFGARWYGTRHMGFSVDMRFYQTEPATPTSFTGARERNTVTVISAGVTFK